MGLRSCLLVGALLLVGCRTANRTPPPPPPELDPIPESPFKSGYRFQFAHPKDEAEPKSVPVVVAVVNPSYRVEESVFEQKNFRPIGRGFSVSLGTDMETILIRKGFTTKGPFPSIDEMTYSEKKSSHLSLVPTVFLAATFKDLPVKLLSGQMSEPGAYVRLSKPYAPGKYALIRRFGLEISGFVKFVLQELMSKEKMWIKKLPLSWTGATSSDFFEAVPVFVMSGGKYPRRVFSGRYKPGNTLLTNRCQFQEGPSSLMSSSEILINARIACGFFLDLKLDALLQN